MRIASLFVAFVLTEQTQKGINNRRPLSEEHLQIETAVKLLIVRFIVVSTARTQGSYTQHETLMY